MNVGWWFDLGTNVKLKDSTALQGPNDFYVYADLFYYHDLHNILL